MPGRAVLSRLADEVTHEPVEGVITRCRGLPQIAFEPAGVGEQMPNGDALARGRVSGTELREVRLHRIVKAEQTLVDELHHQSGGEDLRDGLDLEDCVGSDRHSAYGC